MEDVGSAQISDLTDEKKFEVFINKNLKVYRDQVKLAGWTGRGKQLSEDESMQCVKIHCLSKKKEEDVENLARLLQFDVERSAQEAISIPDKSKIQIKIVYEDSGLAVPSLNHQNR